jgi:hypothetical protein
MNVFLLSPAFCGGRRAQFLLRPDSRMALAQKLQAGELTLGEAFAFMSGLYFRGKLAYAQKFGATVLVITPTRGLQPPELVVSARLLREFATVDVHADDVRYRRPLDRTLKTLVRDVGGDTRIVLLGSIATAKYVDALRKAFGDRLCYPTDFVGRGDMSRGGLMLRAVTASTELGYTPLSADAPRRGTRPPKLPPLPASAARQAAALPLHASAPWLPATSAATTTTKRFNS